jgi:hypothetical protein
LPAPLVLQAISEAKERYASYGSDASTKEAQKLIQEISRPKVKFSLFPRKKKQIFLDSSLLAVAIDLLFVPSYTIS